MACLSVNSKTSTMERPRAISAVVPRENKFEEILISLEPHKFGWVPWCCGVVVLLLIVKGKVFPLQARLWHRGWVELYLYSFMTTTLEGGEWSASRPGRILPPGKTRYPLYRRLGGLQGWSGRTENLVSTGIRSPDRPARSQSLYRLSYPSYVTHCRELKFWGGWDAGPVLPNRAP